MAEDRRFYYTTTTSLDKIALLCRKATNQQALMASRTDRILQQIEDTLRVWNGSEGKCRTLEESVFAV